VVRQCGFGVYALLQHSASPLFASRMQPSLHRHHHPQRPLLQRLGGDETRSCRGHEADGSGTAPRRKSNRGNSRQRWSSRRPEKSLPVPPPHQPRYLPSSLPFHSSRDLGVGSASVSPLLLGSCFLQCNSCVSIYMILITLMLTLEGGECTRLPWLQSWRHQCQLD